jgi:hypothetical protein
MNKSVLYTNVAALALLAWSLPAASAVCNFGPQGGEASLQDTFDTLLGNAAPHTQSDCFADTADGIWRTNGVAAATIIIELAGFADQNIFGIYDRASPGNRLTVFPGRSDEGSSATISFSQNGDDYSVQVTRGNRRSSSLFESGLFGFFLTTPQGNTFYSDSGLNEGYAHPDHMYAYQGTGGYFQSGPLSGQLFDTNSYLLAWEDLRGDNPSYDGDFQDMIVLAQSVLPVPLPAAAIFLLSALPFLMPFRRTHRGVGIPVTMNC